MHTCASCGAVVTPVYARVLGDNQNEVNACPNCPPREEEERKELIV